MSLLEIKNLTVDYLSRRGRGRAVENLSLSIEKGTVLSLVGESGCGKSTLGWSILRLLPRNARIVDGQIFLEGKNLLTLSEKEMNEDIRGKKVSMIIQNPQRALNPVFSIGTQISDVLSFHSKNRKHFLLGAFTRDAKQRREKACEILDRMGIADARRRIDEYPHQFSGGMKQRVMMAMAFITDPDLLIADEPTTALDVTTEAQILQLLKNLTKNTQTAVIYITHNLGIASELANIIAVMYAGSIIEKGRTRTLLTQPMHPYTEALLGCLPGKRGRKESLRVIKGNVPSIFDLPSGCKFHPRCPYREEICAKERPKLEKKAPDHFVACFYPKGEKKKNYGITSFEGK